MVGIVEIMLASPTEIELGLSLAIMFSHPTSEKNPLQVLLYLPSTYNYND